MLFRRGSMALTLACIAVMAVPVGAVEPPAEARAANERAQTCYKLQDWKCSISEWRLAYGIFKSPVILFNLAQAQRQAGDLKSALMSYKFYITDSPDGTYRTVASEMIAKLQPLVDKAEATRSEPPVGVGSTVKADPDKPPQAPPTTAPTTTTTTTTTVVTPATATPPATTATTAAPPAPTTAPRVWSPARKRSSTGIVVGVVVGVVVLAGVGVGVGVGLGTSGSEAPSPSTSLGSGTVMW